jgi:hypothetical protein
MRCDGSDGAAARQRLGDRAYTALQRGLGLYYGY